MKLLVAVLPRAVQWRLRADGPNDVSIAGHPEWSLVTPIGLARTGLAEGVPDRNACAILTKTDELFMMSKRFALRHAGNDEEDADAVLRHVLSRLRYLSRQAGAPRIRRFVELNKAPNYDGGLSASGASRLPGYQVRNDLFETAIAAIHLHELGGPNRSGEQRDASGVHERSLRRRLVVNAPTPNKSRPNATSIRRGMTGTPVPAKGTPGIVVCAVATPPETVPAMSARSRWYSRC